MKAPPGELDTRLIHAALETHWGIRSPTLPYLPLGFGDHHWRAHDGEAAYFVTVVDQRLRGEMEQLERTLQAVHAFGSRSKLPFVVSALRAHAGTFVVPITEHFGLSVFEWLDAQPFYSKPASLTVVRALHARSREHPVDALVEDFSILHRSALEAALDALDEPWLSGAYGEPAREVLRQHEAAIRAALRLHDRLAEKAATSRAAWCLTHGEASGSNLLRDASGALYLVDWESARIAPPERDLWELAPAGGGDPERVLLYRLRWDLSETAVYTMQLHAQHAADANVDHAWRNFGPQVPTFERWPVLLGETG